MYIVRTASARRARVLRRFIYIYICVRPRSKSECPCDRCARARSRTLQAAKEENVTFIVSRKRTSTLQYFIITDWRVYDQYKCGSVARWRRRRTKSSRNTSRDDGDAFWRIIFRRNLLPRARVCRVYKRRPRLPVLPV